MQSEWNWHLAPMVVPDSLPSPLRGPWVVCPTPTCLIPLAQPVRGTNPGPATFWGKWTKDSIQRVSAVSILRTEGSGPKSLCSLFLLPPCSFLEVKCGGRWLKMERAAREWGKPTFSSQIFCFLPGPGQSLGVERCSVFHCGCGGKRETLWLRRGKQRHRKG